MTTTNTKVTNSTQAGRLTDLDLVPDRALVADEPDAFGYQEIAARVADLVVTTETPANIALFGPWGSGKSSFAELLRRALRDRGEDVPVVRYDAWKYGGDSLKRNFISEAARQLGVSEEEDENRDFYRGLYEKRRTAIVDFGKITEAFSPLIVWFVGALALLLALVLIILGLVAWITDASFTSLIRDTLPQTLSSSAVVAFVIGILKMVFDGARVDVEQDAPADEQFSRTFARLVDAQKRGQRLVFFIDELDRCSAEDVVATLADVKNFLDQPGCVFIIAADRDAIERALRQLPQETPVDEEEPYYSTASAFLDKVFQHQIALPPLRERRLTRFARDLVLERSERGGLWLELRSMDDSGRFLDHVVYSLIPSHLRSPRRVKVLLNHFATNARVAESRGIDWKVRAPEIAKLTVLRTEFPLLASDLHIESRLPSLLLDYERVGREAAGAEERKETQKSFVAGQSERVRRLLERHSTGEVDRVLSEGTASAGLVSVQRQQLNRYLERAASAGVPDPTRDLIYLEPAGAAVDLADAELGDLVEAAAVDSPDEVHKALDGRTDEDVRGAARLLADMANREFGDERVNVITALMTTVELLGSNVESVADEVVESLKSFLEQDDLKEEHLVGALVLARAVEGDEDAPLTDELFDDARLLAVPERVRRVAGFADRLPTRHLEILAPHVAEAFVADEEVLLEPLRTLPAEAANDLIRAPEMRNAVVQRLQALEAEDPAAARQLADRLLDAATRSGEGDSLIATAQWHLFVAATPSSYQAVRDTAQVVIPSISNRRLAGNSVFRAITLAPTPDWSFWCELIPEVDEPTKDQAKRAAQAIADVIARLAGAEEADQGAGDELISDLMPYLSGDGESAWEIIQPALQSALDGRQWWESSEYRRLQERLHRIGRRIRDEGPGLSDSVEPMLAHDVNRALSAQPPTTEMLAGVRRMGALLTDASLKELASALSSMPATGTPDVDVEATRARATIAARAKKRGLKTGPGTAFDIEPQLIVTAGAAGTPSGADAVGAWLASDPPFTVAATLPRTLGKQVSSDVVEAFGTWAERLSNRERTDLLIGLGDYVTEEWISAIATYGTEEERLVRHLVVQVEDAPRAKERADKIDLLVHLRPSTGAAQRQVAEMILRLIERDTEADFKNALRAVPALGRDHRRASRLEEAFRKAAAGERKIPAKADDDLRRAGVKLPKKSFGRRMLDLGRKKGS